jgi:CubicO group peptidase (beta-lactamase class C family)
MQERPGDVWTYNGAAPNILMLALDRALPEGVRGFADARLFKPLGIDNYRWGDFEADVPDAGARLLMRPRDMAKLGLLLLNGGAWHGVQIVPRDYVFEATSPQVSTAPAAEHEYGYLMWIRKLALESGETVQYVAIEGDGGNNISVFPDRDLVVVTTGGNYREFPVYEAQGQRLLKAIVPLFAPEPASP